MQRVAHLDQLTRTSHGHPHVVRALKLAPLLTGVLLLYSCALTYAFGASSPSANTVTCLIFGAAVCLALASGVYERPSASESAPDPWARAPVAIDWEEFDEARALWQPGGPF
jgi:hypothetical protein